MKTRSIAKLTMGDSVWNSTLMSRIELCFYMLQESATSLCVSDNTKTSQLTSKLSGKWKDLIVTSALKLIFFFRLFFLYHIRTQYNGANVRLFYFQNFCLNSIKNVYIVTYVLTTHYLNQSILEIHLFLNLILLFFRYSFVLIKVLCSRK